MTTVTVSQPEAIATPGEEGAVGLALGTLAVELSLGLRGPAGPAGSGSVARFDVAVASASWIITHGLGHAPQVQVFLATGEQVMADVVSDATTISVAFATPIAGFVLAS